MYFKGLAINYHHPNFTNFKWLNKARYQSRTKKDLLNKLCFDGQSWAATDGHRIHLFDPETNIYEKGLYNVISSTRTNIVLEKINQDITRYPSYKLIFNPEKIVNFLSPSQLKYYHIDLNYTYIVRHIPDETTISFKYCQDAFMLGVPWNAYLDESKTMLILHFENFLACIMGIRM